MHPNTLQYIQDIATVPSFSSFEERLHPYIEAFAASQPGVEIWKVAERNIVLARPGARPEAPTIALTAHLDKINHFGEDRLEPLPVAVRDGQLEGLLDDAMGVGLALSLFEQAPERDFPNLMVLLSEVEEGTGLRHHPHLMRDNGIGLKPGIGAERISRDLIERGRTPAVAITLDVTPKFKGEPGLALYTDHWEINLVAPSPALLKATAAVRDALFAIEPAIVIENNTNDYLEYGLELNRDPERPVVSVALEPGVCPYHTADERVWIDDIARMERVLIAFLEGWGR